MLNNILFYVIENKDNLRQKRIAVIVISFGVERGAKIWLEETKCSFPLFLDQDRVLYESFGLQRSIEKVNSYNI